MSMFTKQIRIKASQVTPFQYLRPSSLFLLLQEISIEHTEKLGYPREFTLDKGLLWVIAKQHIEITRMPKYDETITISTYPSEMMHVLFPRSYEIKDEKGNIIIQGQAIWALIDIQSRKMINPVEHNIIIPDMSDGKEFRIPLGNKTPTDLMEKAEIDATYSLCDLNGHLNNTSYLDIAEDLISVSFLKDHQLKLIDIKYIHEIKLGEKSILHYGFRNNSYYFSNSAFQFQFGY